MGCLTDGMAQLRKNIDDSHESRIAQQNARVSSVSAQIAGFSTTRARNAAQDARARATFVADNVRGVNRMLSDFCHTREVMSRQQSEERATFVTDMSKKTLALLDGFNAERKSMAERCAKERADFIANVANDVAAFLSASEKDRMAAHAVFFGMTLAKKNEPRSLATRPLDNTLAVSSEDLSAPGSESSVVLRSEDPLALGSEDSLVPDSKGSLAPSSEQPALPEIVQTTAPTLPTTPPATVFEKKNVAEHTVDKQTKKPKKKLGEYLGPKKGK
ncbi:hypothetical protein PCO87_00995 [Pectobacteriaceae bacterium C52]|nr:hypothetical protein PCO87_00995 [Pectobacteriaceae bacterium C52]